MRDELEANRSDPKKYWRRVSELTKGGKTCNNDIVLLSDTDCDTRVPQNDTSGYMKEYFVSVGPELADKFRGWWDYDSDKSEAPPPFPTYFEEVHLI